jgi:succinate-semialdehyde dehydrogenase/glutarate-semialdehyde dehydrogenase
MGFQTQNPATGENLKQYEHFSSDTVEKQISTAYQVFHQDKKTVQERAELLKKIALELRAQNSELSREMTLEMGKAIQDSKSEVEKCAVTCEYFAEHLAEFLTDQKVSLGGNRNARVVKDPLGPILAIMPWNFPVWQVIRFAAPAVGIGNPILLKHANLTAGTATMLQALFEKVQPGLMFNLRIDHDQTARVIADKRVRGVTLTGSTRAGRQVAATAGQYLKKTVLELGGSDAYVVFKDSNIKASAETCAKARMTNNGQSCVAAKRFIVEKLALDEFLNHFQATLKTLKFGDPLDEQTKVGSLASKKFQKQLLEQCEELEKNKARLIYDAGKETPVDFSKASAFFPARIYQVSDLADMAFEQEFFGPVALIFVFETETEALALCNRSPYGLGGAVFTEDLAKAQAFARKMECGFVGINEGVKSDARIPFGGVKDSGHGRELSLYGFNEFCNIKSLSNLN